MKKISVILLILGMVFNLNLVSHCAYISPEALKSAYVNESSWLIDKLEEKIEESGDIDLSTCSNWKKEVLATYRCIDEKSPDSDNIADILKNDEIVNLAIQVGNDDFLEDAAKLTASIEFKTHVDNITEAINSITEPANMEYEIKLYGLSCDPDGYTQKIQRLEETIKKVKESGNPNPVVGDFCFDENTKIYISVIEDYTYGFILVDNSNNKLFWCCKTVREFEEGQLYKLSDVLDAHKKFVKNMADFKSGRIGWF